VITLTKEELRLIHVIFNKVWEEDSNDNQTLPRYLHVVVITVVTTHTESSLRVPPVVTTIRASCQLDE